MIFRAPQTRCPCCGAKLSAMGDLDLDPSARRPPREGDVTCCIGCGEPLIITAGLGLRKPTAAEALTLAGDRHIQMLRRGIEIAKRLRRHKAS